MVGPLDGPRGGASPYKTLFSMARGGGGERRDHKKYQVVAYEGLKTMETYKTVVVKSGRGRL